MGNLRTAFGKILRETCAFLVWLLGSPPIQNGTEHPIPPGLAAGNRVGRAAVDATEGCWPGAQLVHESQLNGSWSMAYGNPKIQRIFHCILLIKDYIRH